MITDADGDSDTATLTITVEGSTDGVPTITDISGDEADHSLTEATGDSVTPAASRSPPLPASIPSP
ncbi:hypothetical protein KDX00_13060 [Cobetia amphilecti]|nr:hypothetical protein KDX00_13060 [Cobetia litoralis]